MANARSRQPLKAKGARAPKSDSRRHTKVGTGAEGRAHAEGRAPGEIGEARRSDDRAARARAAEEKRIFKRIEVLEAEQSALEAQLADPEVYREGGERTRNLLAEYERVRAELAALWDKAHDLEQPRGRAS